MLLYYFRKYKGFIFAANLEDNAKRNAMILHAPISVDFAYYLITYLNYILRLFMVSVKYFFK